MKGQCIVFFLAGYETTATALMLLIHQLAKNPEVQGKLQAELDEHYPNKVRTLGVRSNNTPNKCQFLPTIKSIKMTTVSNWL